MSSKVDFFIVGAPKAGTTSLYSYLDTHPQVCMSSVKEPNYFSAEELKSQRLYYEEKLYIDLEEYEKLFCDDNKKIKGEASVSYLFYPSVPDKIFQYNPAAKIIIMLRDPKARAFSHWQMDERLGMVAVSFERILDDPEKYALHYQQYILLGFYYEQVKRYFDIFGKEKVHIILLDDLRSNKEKVIRNLYSFLNINFEVPDKTEAQNTARRFRNPVLKRLYTNKFFRKTLSLLLPDLLRESILRKTSIRDERQLDAATADRLNDLYKKDIIALEKITGLNLYNWYSK